MNAETIRQTVTGSLAGTHSFPDVVRILITEGVESYHADLVRGEKTFYMPDGETQVEKTDLPPMPIGQPFSASGVISAIRAIQAKEITYVEFLHRIMAAGTTGYVVYTGGRKAIYSGRNGDFHIENFPGAR